jgi:hypothetical protein
MSVFYALGNALVAPEELKEKVNTGAVEQFGLDIQQGKNAIINFSTGILTRDTLPRITLANIQRSDNRSSFVEIGVGKPLTIEIRHIYTGKNPEKKFFSGSRSDMLVSSAMRSLATFNAAPRAINYLMDDIKPKSNLRSISANENGTTLISYSPALVEPNTVLTLEIIFDSFKSDVFDKISAGFKAGAGIPLFAGASFYLLAAGTISKLIGNAGESIFDGHISFKVTEEISFEKAGAKIPVAGFRLLVQDDFDRSTLNSHSINDDGVLVDKDGNPYSGDQPYMVISLDGREYSNYANFTPTAATAAVMDKFYGVKDGEASSSEIIMDALKLYNDWSFREKAVSLKSSIDKMAVGDPARERAEKTYHAYLNNILNPDLKI